MFDIELCNNLTEYLKFVIPIVYRSNYRILYYLFYAVFYMCVI